ncbi:MAG: hypothetical protein AAF646_08055 [Pseudomonadota bacterium]
MYVSITGLRLRRAVYAPRFWSLAIRAMHQAKSDRACLAVDTRTIRGVHHTRSLWVSEAEMRRFLKEGAHLTAMRSFRAIATGKTLGFTAEALPDWAEARRLWDSEAHEY